MRAARLTEELESSLLEAWAFVWAAALLFAMTAAPSWYFFVSDSPFSTRGLLEIATALVALAFVLRPAGVGGLVSLAVVEIALFAVSLPEVPNHRWVLTLVNLSFLAALVTLRSSGPARASAFARFQLAARGAVVTCYAFAFFAKLNWDFLDPEVSCASRFYTQVASWLPFPSGDWALRSVPWATLAFEGFLPIGLLLARGRARVAVIIVGIVFHFFLALDLTRHFVNFSAVMSAGLLLFLPPRSLAALAPPRRLRSLLAFSAVLLASFAFLTVRGGPFAVPFVVLRTLLWCSAAAAVLLRLFSQAPADDPPRPALALGTALVVVLAVANGLSPYLGAKTRTAFDMYSNLRLEADRSNHLLVPQSLDVFGFLGDRVVVLATDDSALGRKLEPGSEWPWFEFARYAGNAPRARIEFVRNGEHVTYDATRGARIESPPWLLRKVLVFRPLGDHSRALCSW